MSPRLLIIISIFVFGCDKSQTDKFEGANGSISLTCYRNDSIWIADMEGNMSLFFTDAKPVSGKCNSIFVLEKENRTLFVNEEGKIIYEMNQAEMLPFKSGLALYRESEGHWVVSVDSHGKDHAKINVDSVLHVYRKDSIALFQMKSGVQVINLFSGKTIVEKPVVSWGDQPASGFLNDWHSSVLWLNGIESDFAYNFDHAEFYEAQKSRVEPINDEFYVVKNQDESYLVDARFRIYERGTGSIIVWYNPDDSLRIEYDKNCVTDPIGAFDSGCRQGLIRGKTDTLLEFLYLHIGVSGQNFIGKTDNGYSIFDFEGKPLSLDSYSDIIYDSNKILACEKEGSWFLYKREGLNRMPGFDEVFYFNDRYLKVGNDGKSGLLNENGQLIIPVEMDHISIIGKDLFLVRKAGRFGVYHGEKMIVPVMFELIVVNEAN